MCRLPPRRGNLSLPRRYRRYRRDKEAKRQRECRRQCRFLPLLFVLLYRAE
jgi:hypothetical protein